MPPWLHRTALDERKRTIVLNAIPTILGLDISSSHIGFCVLRGGQVADHGEWTLAGPIEARCRQAYNRFLLLLDRMQQPDVLAVEAPVARFASAVIAQSRVAGAVLTLAGQRDILVTEVSPAAAKRILTGNGRADKSAMQAAAGAYQVRGEHASDALGVALSAIGKVEVVGC